MAVTLKPVVDLRERLECRGYEPTDRIREHVIVMRAKAASKQAVRQAKAAPAKDKGSR